MKARTLLPILALAAASGVVGSTFGQGTLTPPGAPLPTMKTLDQIEARTAIPGGSAPYTISAPGSYYLTGNLTVSSGDAINVASGNVTIDLNGFTISSTSNPASGNGIAFSGGPSHIAIFNGTIRSGSTVSGGVFAAGPGFVGGINWPSTAPSSVRVSQVSVTGINGYGIDLGLDYSTVVEACTVRAVSFIGIRAGAVSSSTATLCGNSSNPAISAYTAANCVGTLVSGSGNGISVTVDSELRTAIPGGVQAYTISAPGSYHLTGNLTVASGSAITITASGVDLDLGGFTLSTTSNPAFGNGVFVFGSLHDITIKNGHIVGGVTLSGSTYSAGPGFASGISSPSGGPNIVVTGISISGCSNSGIDIPFFYTTVRDCIVNTVGGNGIDADTITGCRASKCGSAGVQGNLVTNCRGDSITSPGISAANATSCIGTSSSGPGIFASGIATNCVGSSGSDSGIAGTIATNCQGSSSSGIGLSVTTANNCQGTTQSGTYGITASTSASFCNGVNNGVGNSINTGTAFGCTGNKTIFAVTKFFTP